MAVPKSPEADSGDREKPGVGVNLEARPVESGTHHNPDANDKHPQVPVLAAASSAPAAGEETANDTAQTKIVEGGGETVVPALINK